MLFARGELGMIDSVMRSIVLATIVAFAISVEHVSVLTDPPAVDIKQHVSFLANDPPAAGEAFVV
jgi:hypothetical protein